MEKKTDLELSMEPSENGLKELVLRWFTETQASLLMHKGHFPDWFQGFATRKDAEEQLREKDLGSFLIRLSGKAIGYILSYKGHDRCRHFVITQNEQGLFVISGDEQTYSSLSELIEHYKVSPIQPFGEYLSSGSDEAETTELYDVVNCKTKSKCGVSVQALRSLWDQKGAQCSEVAAHPRSLQQKECDTEKVPALPPKSNTRKLTGSVSVDNMALSQCVPDKAIHLGFPLSGSIPDTSHPKERAPSSDRALGGDHSVNPIRTPSQHVTHSTLVQAESRSRSLPCLDNSLNEEEFPLQPTTTAASYSTVALKRVTCHTYSLHESRDSKIQINEEQLSSNPLYELARAQHRDATYAEVPLSPQTVDDTYEKIPEQALGNHSNTYETLDDLKSKSKSKSTWGKNKEWKNFFTDYRKK